MEDTKAEDLYVKNLWFNEPLQPKFGFDEGSATVSSKEEEFANDFTERSLELEETSGNALFDFNFQQADEPAGLPRRNACDWTRCKDMKAGNIGIALSNPLDMDDEGRWHDEMDVC